jgi:NAD(P)-dependent dehydrogenase (short-subunit alcohol dehydrogenase family)
MPGSGTRTFLEPDHYETSLRQALTFGRAAKPEEIGWIAAFLASDLSGYTTGSIITIEGGGSSRRSPL